MGLAIAALRIDGDSVRATLGASLEAALGEPVELGPAELALFPLPAARIRDVRIGRAPGATLQAPELRVGVSLASLLAGQVVLRSLELDSPRVRLPAGPTAPREEAPPSKWPSEAPRVRLAITRLVVRDGALEAGAFALARIELRGALGLGPSARFEFAAESPGLARLRDGELELSALTGPSASWPWSARARLVELDLVELRRRFGLPDMAGSAEGTIGVTGRGAASERVSLALASADLDLKGALLRATGRTALAAELPGRLELDLSGAAVAVAGLVEKSAGVPLRVSAQLAEPRSLRFTELRIASPGIEASGSLSLDGGVVLELAPASIDLAGLAGWTAPTWLPRNGRILLERARLGGEPLSAEGSLADVDVPLGEKLSARVSGPVAANGTELRGDELSVALAGQAASVSALYDWRARQLALVAAARGPQIGPIAEALWGRKDVSGRLYGRVELAGPPDLFGLTGEGELELIDGELPGVSIARAAGFERSDEEPAGLDRFEKLAARFAVAGDQMEVLELTLVQEYATATVNGDLALRDLQADFTGAVRMQFPDMPEAKVRPILRMEGRLDALETHISTAETDDVKEIEARTIEAIRKAEREQRERKAHKSGDGE